MTNVEPGIVERELDEARREARAEIDPRYEAFDPTRRHENVGKHGDKYFLGRYKAHKDLIEHFEDVKKNPYDTSAVSDLAVDLYGDPKAFEQMFQSQPQDVIRSGKFFYDESLEKLADYSYENLDDILKVIDDSEAEKQDKDRHIYKSLALSLPLYNTKGEEREHDTLVSVVNKFKSISNVLQEKDPEKRFEGMQNVVDEDVKGLKSDAARRMASFYLSRASFVNLHFGRIAGVEQKAIAKILTPERAREVIKKGIEIAHEEYDKETLDPKDRKDLKKYALRPLLLAVANAVYKIEDAQADRDKVRDVELERKKEERKKERKEKGLPL